MKKQSSSKTSVGKKLDDSFQEVTNRRQAKQVSKQKALEEKSAGVHTTMRRNAQKLDEDESFNQDGTF
jgi:hypothetical protein